MIDPAWLFTDPVPSRVKGWSAKPRGGVRLREAFMAPEVGSGQDIVRDDWRLDRTPAPPPAAPPEPDPQPQMPAWADHPYPASAYDLAPLPVSPRTPRPQDMTPIPNSPVTTTPQDYSSSWQPVQSTVSVSGAGDVGGDWTSGLGMIGNVARQAGHNDEGVMVAQAIARTEGGLFKAEGDRSSGGSYGAYQFNWKGQLPNYAQARGMSLAQAAKFAEDHPEDAAAWALSGYLGNAIKEGQRRGLHGAALATYAQQHGQVSESPERAGEWFNTLFGGSGKPIAGQGSTDQQAASAPQQSAYVFPVQGYSGDVALHWGDVKGGSDLFAPRGTPVLAMRGGKVVEAGYNSIGGNSVLIQADDGNQYYYAHFDKAPAVSVGDTVGAGTYLGPVGNTGDAAHTGTHLHIGIGPSIRLGADKYGGTGGDFDAVGLLRGALQGARSTGPVPSRASPDRQEEEAASAPKFPASGEPVDWFSYVDSGQEVMKITWDNGETTYHALGPAASHSGDPGTVLSTGTLGVGAGANVVDSGDGGDDTEWPIPDEDPTGRAPTITPAPPRPIPADREERITRTSTPPPSAAPSTVSASSGSSVGTRSSDQPPTSPEPTASESQTEWRLPDVGQAIQSASRAVSGTIGAAASAVGSVLNPDVSQLPAASAPGRGYDPSSMGAHAPQTDQVEWQLPDIASRLPQIDMAPPGGQADVRPITPEGVVGQPEHPLTPIARQAAGMTTNPFDVKSQVTEGLAEVVTPDDLPARDWFREGVAQALDPSLVLPGGIENELGQLALKGAGKVAGRVAGKTLDLSARLWDPAVHTFQQSWNRLMPEAARAPAQANAAFAAKTAAGAAAGGGTAALATDRNDPNYWPKIIAGGVGGIAAAHVLAHVTPEIVKRWNNYLEPTANIKNPGVRQSLSTRANNMVSSRGQRWLWENRIEEILGKPGTGNNTLTVLQYIEENGAAPPGSSHEVQQLVSDMLKFTQDTGDEGRILGYIRGDITTRPDSRGVTLKAYVPRVLKDNLNAAKQAPGVWHGKLNPRDNYTFMRQNVSIFDGIKAGVEYDNSISRAFGHYVEHVNASRANALFIKDMKRIAPRAISRIKSPKQVSRIGNGDWKWGGQYLRQWQNVAFAPELHRALQNVTQPGIEDETFRDVSRVLGEAKGALFAPSLFHLGNEVRQVYSAAGAEGVAKILPKTAMYFLHPASERKFWANPAVMAEAKRAMDSGLVLMRQMPDVGDALPMQRAKSMGTQAAWGALTGGAAGYMNARFDPTMTEQERLQRGLEAAGIGALGGAAGGELSRRLWRDTVPYMKFTTWKLLEGKVGGTEAARFVNSVYGGQNLEAIARSRKVQDVLRTAVLAPDWQEGWIRQIGNAFLPGSIRGSIPLPGIGKAPTNVADLNRQYWLRTAVTSTFMLEGLNVALNGHWSGDNGPGHELTLETTGLYDRMGWPHTDEGTGEKYRTYIDILGPYRGMLNAPLDPGRFLSARQGLLPEELSTAVSGKDWRGKDIAPPGADWETNSALRFAYLLSRLAPVGPAEIIRTTGQATNEPLPLQIGLSAAGLRESRMSPLQQKVRQNEDRYRQLGFSVDSETQFKTEYAGALRESERKLERAFDPSKPHAQVAQAVRDVSWPSRQERLKELEPTEIAADPVRNADWVAKMKEIQSVGTQSGGGNADIAWDQTGASLDDASSVYWSPPGKSVDQMSQLPPDAQDRVREAALAQWAQAHNVEPNVVRDAIKAQMRGMDLPKLPGITSDVLDQWTEQWRSITSDDPQEQSANRRAFIDQTAQQYGITPDTVYERIKLRNLPLTHEDPKEPGISETERARREMQTSYERAQDILYGSRDPQQFPKYANPDGTPYKGSAPDQWTQFDQQIAADTKAGRRTHSPEVQALIAARDAANSKRLKAIYGDRQASEDYQRWYGVGRNMNEAHWQEYVSGTGKQFLDINDPTENRRRTRTLELWTASTPQERQTTKVKIKVPIDGQIREEVTSLDLAKKHIERAVDPKWKTDLGLDAPGTGV